MIPILIATSITCADINDMVSRAENYPDITEAHRQEVIDLYYDFGKTQGLNCKDAKARLKERINHPITLGENQMAQVHTVVLDTKLALRIKKSTGKNINLPWTCLLSRR
ncbi:MAG: hypothetical protein CM15mV11_2080 [Caudoviricetes sp.]|nr:MAG: hypothetical protein CM15mV11_2080 [Caudoviricetes sp.]